MINSKINKFEKLDKIDELDLMLQSINNCKAIELVINKNLEKFADTIFENTKKTFSDKLSSLDTKFNYLIDKLESGPSNYLSILQDIIDLLNKNHNVIEHLNINPDLIENPNVDNNNNNNVINHISFLDDPVNSYQNFSMSPNPNYVFGNNLFNLTNDNQKLSIYGTTWTKDEWNERLNRLDKIANKQPDVNNTLNSLFVKGIEPSLSSNELSKLLSDIFKIEIKECIDVTPKKINKKFLKYKCFKISIADRWSKNIILDKRWKILNATVEKCKHFEVKMNMNNLKKEINVNLNIGNTKHDENTHSLNMNTKTKSQPHSIINQSFRHNKNNKVSYKTSKPSKMSVKNIAVNKNKANNKNSEINKKSHANNHSKTKINKKIKHNTKPTLTLHLLILVLIIITIIILSLMPINTRKWVFLLLI